MIALVLVLLAVCLLSVDVIGVVALVRGWEHGWISDDPKRGVR